MRCKLFVAILMVTILIVFTSCKSNNYIEPNNIKTNFASYMDVTLNGKYILCSLECNDTGNAKITAKEPENLENLRFSFNGTEHEISYNELSCKSNNCYLSDTAFAKAVFNVLDALNNKSEIDFCSSNDGLSVYNGKCNSGSFKIVVDNKTHFINQIIIDEIGLNVKLFEQKSV